MNVGSNSATQTFTLTNSGTASATGCSAPALGGANSTEFTITTDNCGTSDLAGSGATCTVLVRANPSATGSKTATLSRTCSFGGIPSTTANQIVVNGIQPSLAWSPLTKDFGNINVGSNSSTQTFTLSNSGGSTATGCTAPALTNSTDFTITTDNCGTSDLAGSGATCTVLVQANPTTAGAKTTTLSRTCSWGGSATTTANQIVTTGIQPNLAWSPLVKDFGNIDVGSNSTTQTFTLTNAGAAAATGCTAPTLSNSTDFTITTDNCGTLDLAASSATCTVLVRANPATAGAHSATLSRTCSFGGTASTTSNQIVTYGLQTFTQNWPFDFGTDSSYTFDSAKIDFTGGVARLTGNDQVDNDNTASGFGGGTLAGTTWDATNGYLRMSQSGSPTNRAELESSWAPKWSNIVGVWHLNEAAGATTFADSSGKGNTGTKSNTLTSGVTSKLGLGVDVSGGGTIDFPLLVPTGDMTISDWVYWNGTSTNNHLFFNGIPGTNGFAIDVAGSGCSSGNLLTVYMPTVSCDVTNSTYTLPSNAWTHIALTRSGNLWSLYANGRLVASGTRTPITPTGVTRIGTWGFNGVHDEVGIWNAALSAADIATIYARQSAKYSSSFTSRVMDALSIGQSWTTLFWTPTLPFFKELPDYASGAIQNETSTDYTALVGSTGSVGDNDLMSGIVGLWHLDETATGSGGAGKDFKDSSPSGYWGTKNGTMSLGQTGKLRYAPEMDGSTGFIDIGAGATALDQTDRTLSAWIYPTGYSSVNPVFDKEWDSFDGTNYGGWGFWIRPDGRLWFWTESYKDVIDNGAASAPLNQWSLVTLTYSQSTKVVNFYINGVLNSTATSTATEKASGGTAKLLIGAYRNGTGHFFQGRIDEAAAWTRVLNPKEILQLYRRGANRVKHQVRICSAADCSDDATGANWKGPDGTNQTYFSELNNNTVPNAMTGLVKKALPSMLFSDFTSPVGASRYFQYRTILESDDAGTSCNYGSGATWCSPELKSVTVDPVHYDSSAPSVVGKTGVAYVKLASFVETLGTTCASGVGYNLGIGASSGAATWYWWDASANAGAGAWVTANGTSAQSNSATTLSTNLAAFATTLGTGTVYFKAYLKSSGSTACGLDNLSLSGSQ